MKRVMIVGGPGSGKSTLARMLGEKTGLPVFHMDQIHWMPGWVEQSPAEKDRLTSDVHRKDQWIFEGGHSRSWGERVARADTYIWLDVPIGLRICRVLQRSWRFRGRSRPDLPEGCPERFNMQTVEFLTFIVKARRRSRERMAAIYQNPPAHLSAVRLTGVADTRAYLGNLPRAG